MRSATLTFAPNHRPIANELISRHSSLIEKTLEYHLAGAIASELLLRGRTFELLRTDCDRDGHDLVIWANGITRHIQLKSQIAGGRSREVTAQTALTRRSSACIIWMTYDPTTLRPCASRFFGGAPGERIPALGSKIAVHSRGKGPRPDHRIIAASRFETVATIEELVNRLFGIGRHEIEILTRHMAGRPEPDEQWLAQIRSGNFGAIPSDLNWSTSHSFAHLIDGYALLQDEGHPNSEVFADEALSVATQTGKWVGDARDLWISLFLEHRRWRFSGPYRPDREQEHMLNILVRQLREKLSLESYQSDLAI